MSKNEKHLELLNRMAGKKVLIKGNHDLVDNTAYQKYFYDIKACHSFEGMILTHIPIHPDSLARWGCNVHGHLHSNRVKLGKAIDKRYFNVSVECINYTPISLEEVKKEIKI